MLRTKQFPGVREGPIKERETREERETSAIMYLRPVFLTIWPAFKHEIHARMREKDIKKVWLFSRFFRLLCVCTTAVLLLLQHTFSLLLPSVRRSVGAREDPSSLSFFFSFFDSLNGQHNLSPCLSFAASFFPAVGRVKLRESSVTGRRLRRRLRDEGLATMTTASEGQKERKRGREEREKTEKETALLAPLSLVFPLSQLRNEGRTQSSSST